MAAQFAAPGVKARGRVLALRIRLSVAGKSSPPPNDSRAFAALCPVPRETIVVRGRSAARSAGVRERMSGASGIIHDACRLVKPRGIRRTPPAGADPVS